MKHLSFLPLLASLLATLFALACTENPATQDLESLLSSSSEELSPDPGDPGDPSSSSKGEPHSPSSSPSSASSSSVTEDPGDPGDPGHSSSSGKTPAGSSSSSVKADAGKSSSSQGVAGKDDACKEAGTFTTVPTDPETCVKYKDVCYTCNNWTEGEWWCGQEDLFFWNEGVSKNIDGEDSANKDYWYTEVSCDPEAPKPSSSSQGTGGSESTGVFLAGDDVNKDGPLALTQENLSFSGGGHILVRPRDLSTDPNKKHPVAIWGPGGGTPPGDYMMVMNRLASQGFVVIGIRESSGGSELMSDAIDWLEQSSMADKLILDRVGVHGHSMGGLSSEATAAVDSRVATALLNNSGSLSHNGLVNMKVPTGIIYGSDGMERPNAEGDFNNAGNKGPIWLGMMAGGGHGSGPWDGAGANVAWMRWHIGGENFRKDAFMGQGGAYNNTGIWTTTFKNWDGWKNWNE
jgi:hypothetical protein